MSICNIVIQIWTVRWTPTVVLKSRNLQCGSCCEMLLRCFMKTNQSSPASQDWGVRRNWILIFKCSLSGEVRSASRYIRKLYKISQHLTGQPASGGANTGYFFISNWKLNQHNNPSFLPGTNFFPWSTFPPLAVVKYPILIKNSQPGPIYFLDCRGEEGEGRIY